MSRKNAGGFLQRLISGNTKQDAKLLKQRMALERKNIDGLHALRAERNEDLYSLGLRKLELERDMRERSISSQQEAALYRASLEARSRQEQIGMQGVLKQQEIGAHLLLGLVQAAANRDVALRKLHVEEELRRKEIDEWAKIEKERIRSFREWLDTELSDNLKERRRSLELIRTQLAELFDERSSESTPSSKDRLTLMSLLLEALVGLHHSPLISSSLGSVMFPKSTKRLVKGTSPA